MPKHFLIRHAHRLPFRAGDWGHEVSITKEGRKAAKVLGKDLSYLSVEKIWTSPIKRCIETGEALQEGLKGGDSMDHSYLLGDPGFMIEKVELAQVAFLRLTIFEILDALLSGEKLLGFYPAHVGCRKMMEFIMENKGISQVLITHDINIALLAGWIFHKKKGIIPEFLEGIEFSFEKEGIFASYKGLRVKIDETSFRGVIDSRVSLAV